MLQMRINRRRHLCRFVGWFSFANALLFIVIGLNLLWMMPMPGYVPWISVRGAIAAFVFIISTYIGFYSVLAMLAGLPVLILTALIPRKWFAMVLAVIVMTLAQMYLVVDSSVYHIYHFHMLGVVWRIIASGAFFQVIELSSTEYAIAFGILVVLLLLEVVLAMYIWRKLEHAKRTQGKLVALIISMLMFLSVVLFVNALNATSIRQLAIMSHHMIELDAEAFPFYESWLGPVVLGQDGGDRLQSANAGFFVQMPQVTKKLNYPLTPLKFKPVKKPLNIVIIGIDTWRYDSMSPIYSPNIYRFAKRSMEFHDHYSSGDCTRPGLFGLFYSVPPTYWTAMLQQKRGSFFIDTLMKKHYQMGVYMSASMHFPAFDQTVFLNLPNKIINTKGKTSYARDETITQEFHHFIVHRKKDQPFFSFLFYDQVHNYCGPMPPHFKRQFKPYIKHCDRFGVTKKTDELPYKNRYRNAVYFDDSLVARDLALLKKQHLLKNTVVILTSDHGESFNDNNDGYWGHASGFVKYQTHVPMIIHWPGKPVANIDYKTSHYDIVPTLMSKVLGVTTPTSDYSVGHCMYAPGNRPFLISGSYIDYAILTNHNITVIYPQGTYQVQNLAGKNQPEKHLNIVLFKKAYQQMTRFFQH